MSICDEIGGLRPCWGRCLKGKEEVDVEGKEEVDKEGKEEVDKETEGESG
jgi:hypothetical protein